MRIEITLAAAGQPAGRLADAAIVFGPEDGMLDGLQLIGFGLWQQRTGKRNVTYPARQYTANGARHSVALLRPAGGNGIDTRDRLTAAIWRAYDAHVDGR